MDGKMPWIAGGEIKALEMNHGKGGAPKNTIRQSSRALTFFLSIMKTDEEQVFNLMLFRP